MHAFPHQYRVEGAGGGDGDVTVSARGLPSIATAAPAEFGGPGGRWSPETLLVAATVDCFILTFRAIALASKFAWTRVTCSGDGTVDRAEGITRFTGLALHARLAVPAGADLDKGKRLLEKAERGCLVTRSLALTPAFTCEVEVG